MFIKCTTGPFRIDGKLLQTGDTHEVTERHLETLQGYIASGTLSVHEKDPNKKPVATKLAPKSATIEETKPKRRRAPRRTKTGEK